MDIKQFVTEAIKNGYTNKNCEGWDWIKDNLHLLDDIFQSPEYKSCGGMKYKCMPLFGELNRKADQVMSTAWYLNNQREKENKKRIHKEQMLKDGFLELTEEVFDKAIKEGKRLDVRAKKQGVLFTNGVNFILKPIRDYKGYAFLLLPKCTRKGFYLATLENAFCKLV